VAVIGSGPAGFYTAYRVMAKIEDAHVDMYERLPVPFGLVRYGVAPDHPEVKVSPCARVGTSELRC
jgi:adrenodoxin-NADP+ reductase